ncbi:hypothetical protein H0H81_008024 [Sphagnurus paluster]|uniref:Uncharacterized protein n=1 Tax=Sphagnurus paluster TaxID=117069 RepID=A0A9P7GKT3_9AGAR|nr:hypothetical protein H0H81_008024 [Sphagnurus paluster]
MPSIALSDASTPSSSSSSGRSENKPPEEADEHFLKITGGGRPFQKDIADLFATFIAAIELKSHKRTFRTHANCFSTNDALQILESLKFSQSTRAPNPDQPKMFVTTTTNFLFSMSRKVAMELCQRFTDARYIVNAVDASSYTFKERSLYSLTPKGLHILEFFVRKTGIDIDHIQPILESQIACPRLFHFQRDPEEDKIVFSDKAMTALFRWFAGKRPNYPNVTTVPPPSLEALFHYTQRSRGVALMDWSDRGKGAVVHRNCFEAAEAVNWLSDFTTMVARDEAGEAMAHFVRMGLIGRIWTPRKNTTTFTAGAAEFVCAPKVIYHITEKGRDAAGWPERPDEKPPKVGESIFRDGMSEKYSTVHQHLRFILKERPFRALFRQFQQGILCDENISFWMEVDALSRKSEITSSAAAWPPAASQRSVRSNRRKYHQALLEHAQHIYRTYIQAGKAPCEVNPDHYLRKALCNFLDTVRVPEEEAARAEYAGDRHLCAIMHCDSEQLQTLIRHYSILQDYVFRLMLIDPFPKVFIQPALG